MLAAILTILKVLGIILLIILALLLLVAALILFVPVRYKAKASYYKEPLADINVSWLLHLVSFNADYEEEFDYSLRVLGINIYKKKSEEEAEEDIEEEVMEETETSISDEKEEPSKAYEKEVRQEAREEAREEYEKEAAFEERTEPDERLEHPGSEFDIKEARERESEARILREWDKAEEIGEEIREGSPLSAIRPYARNFFHSVRDFFKRIIDILKDRVRYLRVELWAAFIERRDWLIWLLRDPENVKTYHLLWRQLKKLIKHIKPRKVEGDVKFGFDDPYTTGQVLVAISPFYGLYGGHFTVTPVFGEEVAEGKVSLKGRFTLFTLLTVIVRVIMDKNFRSLWDRFMNS